MDSSGYGQPLMLQRFENLQEAAVVPPHVALAVRPNPGIWEYVKVNSNNLEVSGITATEYLKFKEMIFDENWYVLSTIPSVESTYQQLKIGDLMPAKSNIAYAGRTMRMPWRSISKQWTSPPLVWHSLRQSGMGSASSPRRSPRGSGKTLTRARSPWLNSYSPLTIKDRWET